MRMYWGLPGYGKTLFLAMRCANFIMDSLIAVYDSYDEVDYLNSIGFNFNKDYKHLAFANFDVSTDGLGDPDLRVYKFNPFRFGFFSKDFKTEILPPYSKCFITEFQNYADSNMYQYLRSAVKSAYQTKRHYYDLDFEVDCQRPIDIAKPIRSLFNEFWEFYKKVENVIVDNVVVGHKFFIRVIDNPIKLEKYLENGDVSLCKEITITTDKCYFSNYNSYFAKMSHLRGRENQDFNIRHFNEEDDSDILISPEGYWEKKTDKTINNKRGVIYYD